MKPATTTVRAERAQSRLRSARWFGIGRYHLERWSIEDGAWPMFAVVVFVLTLFEPWLWGWAWADVGISEGVGRGLLWVPATVIVGNAFLFHRLLSLQTPRNLTVVPWVALVRAVLASLPLAGMVALPAWRGLTEKHPRWAFRPRSAKELQLRLPGDGEKGAQLPITWHSAERARLAQIALLVSFPGGLLAFLALGFGLGRLGVLRPTPLVLASFAVLHLASYACARVSFRQQRADRPMSPRTAVVLQALAACCLLPFPGPLAAFLLPFLERSRKTFPGLVWRARARRRSELTPSPRPGLAFERRLAFLRWQVPLLVLEAGLLPGLVQEISRRWPAVRPYAASGGKMTSFVILAISGLGFAVWLALVSLNALRQSETEPAERWKAAAYSLGVTYLALAFGGQAGFYFAGSEDPRRVWALLAMVCALAAILKWLLSMGDLVGGRQERKPWNGAFVWLALAWVAAMMTRDPRWGTMAIRTLAAVAILSPLWHLLLVRTLGDWLFWPVSWTQAFDPRFPKRLRRRVRLAALVAALPFGGLLAPLWPFVRALFAPAVVRAWWKIGGLSIPLPPPVETPQRKDAAKA